MFGRLLVGFLVVVFGCGASLEVPKASSSRVEQEVEFQQELVKQRPGPWVSEFVLSRRWSSGQAGVMSAYYRLCRVFAGLEEAQGLKAKGGFGFWLEAVHVGKQAYFRPLLERGYVSEESLEAVVAHVVPGSSAERAGLKRGDVLVEVGGQKVLGPIDAKWQRIDRLLAEASGILDRGCRLKVWRVEAGEVKELEVELWPDRLLEYGLVVVPEAKLINAWTDGKGVYVTEGLLGWAKDETQVAAVLAHEMSHIVLGHVSKTKTRATIGGILGLVLDLSAAAAGINTRGIFSGLGAHFGALLFSQEQEREADYLMTYTLARAGFDFRRAPEVFRELAVVSPKSIKGGYLSTHPGTAERTVYVEETVKEIEAKLQSGISLEQLEPERKKKVEERREE